MNKKIAVLLLSLCAIFIFDGCTTTQKRIAYNSLFSVAQAVDKSMAAYSDLIVAGKINASTLAQVVPKQRAYQAAMATAIDAAKGDLSQPTPELVTQLANDLMVLITQIIQQVKGS